jgi:hypothetical protein
MKFCFTFDRDNANSHRLLSESCSRPDFKKTIGKRWDESYCQIDRPIFFQNQPARVFDHSEAEERGFLVQTISF